jgi:hypothetical protein
MEERRELEITPNHRRWFSQMLRIDCQYLSLGINGISVGGGIPEIFIGSSNIPMPPSLPKLQ